MMGRRGYTACSASGPAPGAILATSGFGAVGRRCFSGTDGSVRSTSPADAHRAPRPHGGGRDLGGATRRPRLSTREGGRSSATHPDPDRRAGRSGLCGGRHARWIDHARSHPCPDSPGRNLRAGRAPHRYRARGSLGRGRHPVERHGCQFDSRRPAFRDRNLPTPRRQIS